MTKKLCCLVSSMLIVAVLSAAIAFGDESDKGKALYDEKCMICHGANGKGDGPAAAALSPPPNDFNRSEFWNQKNVDQLITNQVKNGQGAMPAFKLSDDEIKSIIDYMSHSFKK